jgi:hypothetical protein
MKRPFSLYILGLLHMFVGVNAVAGGILMMIKPDGSLLGMQADWLINSPFKNYFIPGLILFFMLGVFSVFTAWSLFRRPQLRFLNAMNGYANMHWAWAYSLYSGVITIIWILVQMMMTRYFWLQPLIIFCGLLVIVFTLLPVNMKHFKISDK